MDTPADLLTDPPADHPATPAGGGSVHRPNGRAGRLELANDNAAAFWLAQAAANGWEHLGRPHFTAVRGGGGGGGGGANRIVITRPYGEPGLLQDELAELLLGVWGGAPFCVEDPYGRLDLTPLGCEASLGQPVMVREPGPLPPAATTTRRRATPGAPTATVRHALDAEALADVERVVVDGFPIRDRQPWRRGELLPPALLDRPGFRAWLGLLDGHPAGACTTFDSGDAVGLYWVATLSEHRSHGLARTVLTHALAAHPDRPATLTATLLGEPLYRHLGFTEQALTRWWRHQPH